MTEVIEGFFAETIKKETFIQKACFPRDQHQKKRRCRWRRRGKKGQSQSFDSGPTMPHACLGSVLLLKITTAKHWRLQQAANVAAKAMFSRVRC